MLHYEVQPRFSHQALEGFTPQLADFTCQLGCPKIVLDHISIIIILYNICAHDNA